MLKAIVEVLEELFQFEEPILVLFTTKRFIVLYQILEGSTPSPV